MASYGLVDTFKVVIVEILFLKIILFIYIIVYPAPPQVPPPTIPHPILPPLCLREGAPPTRSPLSLGPQGFPGLYTSSSTEARPGKALLPMCQGPQTSPCMILVGSTVSGSFRGFALVETVGLPLGCSLFQFLQPFQ